MVLDDRTARTYNLDSPSLVEPTFGSRRAERSILDDDDLIADEVTDLVEEDDEDDYEEDDEDDYEE